MQEVLHGKGDSRFVNEPHIFEVVVIAACDDVRRLKFVRKIMARVSRAEDDDALEIVSDAGSGRLTLKAKKKKKKKASYGKVFRHFSQSQDIKGGRYLYSPSARVGTDQMATPAPVTLRHGNCSPISFAIWVQLFPISCIPDTTNIQLHGLI